MSINGSPSIPFIVSFLHGINNTPATWDACRSQVVAAQTVAPALAEDDSIVAIARRLFDDLPDTVVLIGHSFGGYVALEMLHQQPERIVGLALVNSSDAADSAPTRTRREKLAEMARNGGYLELANAATAASYAPGSLDDDLLMRERAATVKQYGARAYAAHQSAAAGRADQRQTLRQFDGPKLVVAAEHDALFAPEDQHAMAVRAGCEFAVVPTAGHMLPAEQPQLLTDILNHWLITSYRLTAHQK